MRRWWWSWKEDKEGRMRGDMKVDRADLCRE